MENLTPHILISVFQETIEFAIGLYKSSKFNSDEVINGLSISFWWAFFSCSDICWLGKLALLAVPEIVVFTGVLVAGKLNLFWYFCLSPSISFIYLSVNDVIAGCKKDDQFIPERVDIVLKLPQQLLHELYTQKFGVKNDNLWTTRDLNPRHLQCKWSALPAELIVLLQRILLMI